METKKSQVISTDDLAKILDDPRTKVLDCSVPMMREPGDDPAINYLKSHIKGAQYLDLFNLKDHSTNLPLMMPNEAYFVATMKRLNVKLTD